MFKIPIIQLDLRHEETIVQAAFALDCLQKTIENIFKDIDRRIENNNVKVKQLDERIQKAQLKIRSLFGIKKAIHLYAPAKFPASQVFKDISTTFISSSPLLTDIPASMSSGEDQLNKTPKYEIHNKLDNSNMDVNDKLVFFHVRSEDKSGTDISIKEDRQNINNNTTTPGVMPLNLKSVSSTLLCNSDIHVYDHENDSDLKTDCWKYAKLHKGSRQQVEPKAGVSKHILEPAPHSLAYRNTKFTPAGHLRYTPKQSEAPNLDLPRDLPDLPGIADDLHYENHETEPHITPSLPLIVEDLPHFTEIGDDKNFKSTTIQYEETVVESSPQPNSKSTSEAVDVPLAPVPPPPPPPAMSQPARNIISNKSRSELMEAIRNAGGIGKARLRHASPLTVVPGTSEKTATISKTSSNSANGKDNDLIADLHNKLLMRRKGISGSSKYDNNEARKGNMITGNSVISKLCFLIPPPNEKGSDDDKDDDDNDGDDDWID